MSINSFFFKQSKVIVKIKNNINIYYIQRQTNLCQLQYSKHQKTNYIDKKKTKLRKNSSKRKG